MAFAGKTFFLICLLGLSSEVEGNCSFPSNLTGEWISATKGELFFNATSIRNFPTSVNLGNIFNFHCILNKDNLYFLRAEEFINVFGSITRFYLCLEIHELSENLMYYYVATEFDKFAKDNIFGESENHDALEDIMNEACNVPTPYSPGTFVTLVRKDAVKTLNITCPVPLLAKFSNLTITNTNGVSMTSTGSCQGSNVDVCTDRTTIQVNNNCSSPRTLSTSGTYQCLHDIASDGVTFLSLWNHDLNTDETNTFRFSCLAYRRIGGDVFVTETPQICTNITNYTYTETGLSMFFTDITETCLDTGTVATTTPGPPVDVSFLVYFLIIPGILVLIWIILVVVFLLRICWKKHGCICKQICRQKGHKKDVKVERGEKVPNKRFTKNKLSPLLPNIHKESLLFKPKRAINISKFDLYWGRNTSPTMTPMSKLSPLYHDSILDYMQGKMQRRPSALSVYSFDSIIFDNHGYNYRRSLTNSTLISASVSSTISEEVSTSTLTSVDEITK